MITGRMPHENQLSSGSVQRILAFVSFVSRAEGYHQDAVGRGPRPRS